LAPDARERSCVLLFARSSRAEAFAKGVAGAEALFELAVRRAIAAAGTLGIDLIVAGDSTAGPPGKVVLEQRGQSFGERLQAAFADARRLGYRRIVAVGNDTPGLTARHLRRAFAALERAPLVLGPSTDGGVYLIGAATAIEERFAEVRWNARETLSDLLALGGAVLPERLRDVDGSRDLVRLEAGRDRALSRALAEARGRASIEAAELPAPREIADAAHAIRGPPA
jgi:glycosyltransferase A (GT-A) superfamily protein (DUF2064 family)